jgi:hypothetical protein
MKKRETEMMFSLQDAAAALNNLALDWELYSV